MPADLLDEIRIRTMVAALELIMRDGCENHNSHELGWCCSSSRTPDAEYTAYRWCRPCVAWRALNGGPAHQYADGRVLKPGAVTFDE